MTVVDLPTPPLAFITAMDVRFAVMIHPVKSTRFGLCPERIAPLVRSGMRLRAEHGMADPRPLIRADLPPYRVRNMTLLTQCCPKLRKRKGLSFKVHMVRLIISVYVLLAGRLLRPMRGKRYV